MNIRDLEAFLAVVETGSLVAASARLHVTQPGLTRRIQNLEEELGTALLDRQSKPFKPTAAGREAYERGRRVLHSINDLVAGVSPDAPLEGEMRIGVMPYLSEAALALPLDRLREAYPKLSLRILSGWSPALVAQLQRSEVDAAILCLTEGASEPDGLAGDDLGGQPVLLVAAPELGVPATADLARLAEFPWVMNETGCGFRASLRNHFESRGLPFNVAAEAQSADLRLSLVARGMGIGIVTPAAFAACTCPDRYMVIRTPGFAPSVRAWLLHRPPAGRYAGPLAVLREALLQALALPGAVALRA
ncbi:LysR family transcriptional regulator [Achromobacter aloeverae]|uniref:LysR family transcriptional regulator n=1 Tax=Achromobacter aloeverae TaxID=1750518 RepID=A0A4Q1HI03_9BURK|nr:LysR family transcriptional regulator [Achromobacter aloeverae]RXN87834.1 LysR family transcriptional regulator [Achromobacter aloeverae]